MVDAPVQVEIIFGAHALVEAGKLQQSATAGANGLALGAGIKAQDPRLSRRWFQQAQQQMDGGGFARPVGPQKAKDDACRHLQREIIDRFDGAKDTGKVFCADSWFGHTAPFSDTLRESISVSGLGSLC